MIRDATTRRLSSARKKVGSHGFAFMPPESLWVCWSVRLFIHWSVFHRLRLSHYQLHAIGFACSFFKWIAQLSFLRAISSKVTLSVHIYLLHYPYFPSFQIVHQRFHYRIPNPINCQLTMVYDALEEAELLHSPFLPLLPVEWPLSFISLAIRENNRDISLIVMLDFTSWLISYHLQSRVFIDQPIRLFTRPLGLVRAFFPFFGRIQTPSWIPLVNLIFNTIHTMIIKIYHWINCVIRTRDDTRTRCWVIIWRWRKLGRAAYLSLLLKCQRWQNLKM